MNIVAEADRGAYDESLASLTSALRLKDGPAKPADAAARNAVLPAGMRAAILDAYYQKLLQGNQVEIARKAMRLIAEGTDVPAIRDLASHRLKALGLIGQPAPRIAGVDLDGKPIPAGGDPGEVVLVVFWASWCVPKRKELPLLEQAYRTYHPKGFRIVGVNLDATSGGGPDAKSVLPHVRRFVLDHNIPLAEPHQRAGDQDVAKAFGVTEIPANVLIGRDGKVLQIDLTGPRLEQAVARAVNPAR